MKTYDMQVTVTYHIHGVEAEDEQAAEEYGYYNFDEFPFAADVHDVRVYEVGDDEDETND